MAPHHALHASLVSLLVSASLSYAQTSTVSAPGQPSRSDAPIGQYDIVGNSLVSAQQVSRPL